MEIVEFLKSLPSLFDAKNLTSSLAGAFFGSWSAFWLSAREQDKRAKAAQLSFITYSVSALAHLIGQLYIIKKGIVLPRVKEASDIKKEVLAAINSGINPTVKLREQSKFIQVEGMISPLKADRADFLAQEDPHIIYLVSSLNGSVLRLNQIIYDCNYYLHQAMSSSSAPDLNLLSDYTQNFLGQTDEALYLAEKAQEVLISFGKRFFKRAFKIKSVDILNEWKNLKPPKVESWENLSWFPRKRNIFVKIIFKLLGRRDEN